MPLAKAGKAKAGRLSRKPKDLASEDWTEATRIARCFLFPEGVSGRDFRFTLLFLFGRTNQEKEYFL